MTKWVKNTVSALEHMNVYSKTEPVLAWSMTVQIQAFLFVPHSVFRHLAQARHAIFSKWSKFSRYY